MASESSVPRVLVLLAARNGAPWIARQLRSVLGQTSVNVQIDVRDDSSSDETPLLVADIASADARVRLLPDNRASGSAAGNFFELIRQASASEFDLVAFCDQDDEWFANKLSRAAQCLAASGADGYSAATKARWPDGHERLLAQNSVQRSADYLFEGAGQGCTFVITLRVFGMIQDAVIARAGLIRKIHYHDWATYALTRSAGMGWHIDSQPVMNYSQHAANDTGARTSLSGIFRRVSAIRSGWYHDQVDAVTELTISINPNDFWANRWATISRKGTLRARAQRLAMVVRHGRRRMSDRMVQAMAVICGYL